MENINEIFAPPVALTSVPVLGSKLYTSFILKKSYLFSLSRVAKLSPVIGKIKELTNNEKIIPCFLLKPGIISRLISKMFESDRIRAYDQFFREEMKKAFGFFNSDDGKIYILINNKELKVNKYGFVDTDKIASITVHESTHMASVKNVSKFASTFNTILLKYYGEYFKSLFSLESVNDQIVQQIINLLFVKFEKAKKLSRGNMVNYKKLLMQFKDVSTADNFDKIINDYFVAITIFIKSTSRFISETNKFNHILNPIQSTYKKIFGGTDPGNIPIQELIFPSEVIAIGSEIGNNTGLINNIFKLL